MENEILSKYKVLEPNDENNLGIEIIDDFLPKDEFDKMKEVILSASFPWYYTPSKVTNPEGIPNTDENWTKMKLLIDEYNWQFFHVFYINNVPNSNHLEVINPLLEKINPFSWIKVRGTCNVKTPINILGGGFHTDLPPRVFDIPLRTGIFYFSTNNGGTLFEEGWQTRNIENRLVTFPVNLRHSALTCTDVPVRIQINLNFVPVPPKEE